MKIYEIDNNSNKKKLRTFLTCNSKTLIYAEPCYLNVVGEHLNAHVKWFVAEKKGKIVGALPFLFKNGPLGKVFNSLAYYGGNGGVIQAILDDNLKEALIKSFYDIAKKSGACSATIITNPLEQDHQFYEKVINYDFRDERIGQITHLPQSQDSDHLMKMFENPRPRNIRKALKEGVEVKKGNLDEIDFLFETHFENIKSIGGLPKKKSFFMSLSQKLDNEKCAIFTAYIQGKPVAALLLLYFNETVEYFTPVILPKYRNTQALSLVIFIAMKDAILHGFKNWNWGGTWLSQKGVYDFKKKWGTKNYPYYYYTLLFNNELLSSNADFIKKNYEGFFVLPFNFLNFEKRGS